MNLPDDVIVMYQHSTAVSDGVKKALAEVVKRKQELQTLLDQRHEQEQTINVITQEQARIRENMSRLDRNNDLYGRYVKKFSEQEDQVEKSRGQIDQLNKQITERSARRLPAGTGFELSVHTLSPVGERVGEGAGRNVGRSRSRSAGGSKKLSGTI